MDETAWKRLLIQIRAGLVVPVVGCRLLVDADGNSDLQAKVARQVLATRGLDADGELPPFRELNEAVIRLRENSRGRLQDLYTDVDTAIREVTGSKDFVIPASLRQLAEIGGFRLFVTLTPDDLLARSLGQHRIVNEVVYALKLSEQKDLPRDWKGRPREAQLLYLFGKSTPAPDFAIHDEDVLEYAHNVISREKCVPTDFINELRQLNLLMIGCNFPDWLSRFILRATRKDRFDSVAQRSAWLVEPLTPEESLTCFLRSYSQDTDILSGSDPTAFVAELHRRWMKEYGAEEPEPAASAISAPPSQAIFFISYSRQTDLQSAKRLFQALRELGAEPGDIWLDEKDIEPGQDLDDAFEGVRHCRYFLALLSKAGDRRQEAFVYEEWREANKRRQRMKNRDGFIFPVVIDSDCEVDRYIEGPVREGEWGQLLFCHAPAGVPDEKTRKKFEQLLRDARRPGAAAAS